MMNNIEPFNLLRDAWAIPNSISTLDLNRCRYRGSPTIKLISEGKAVFAHRDKSVGKFVNFFADLPDGASTHGLYKSLLIYSEAVNETKYAYGSKKANHQFVELLITRLREGRWKSVTCKNHYFSMKALFRRMDISLDGFGEQTMFDGSSQASKPYTAPELKLLLKVLRTIFDRLSDRILKNPEQYIKVGCRKPTDNITIMVRGHSKCINISSAINKCLIAGFYLLSYYTAVNTTTLFSMGPPRRSDNGCAWYKQSNLKRRSNSFVQIELGDNGTTDVPRYALKLMNTLLRIHDALHPDVCTLLFSQAKGGDARMISYRDLDKFNENFLSRILQDKNGNRLTDCFDQPLRCVNRRLRDTFSYLTHTSGLSDIERSQLLGNTPDVANRHYSEGSMIDNNLQLQSASHTLEQTIRHRSIASGKLEAAKLMEIDILPLDAFMDKYFKGVRTAAGSGCTNPYDGKQPRKFNLSVKRNELSTDGELLACADLSHCFECDHCAIIEEVDDLWCLLSFKEHIEESVLFHADDLHHKRNYGNTLASLTNALTLINKKKLDKAVNKLEHVGRHPMWPELGL